MLREGHFRGTDRFAIGRRLGHGGMGVVYEAYDRERGHPVALKVLSHVDAAGIYRLKREFRTLADITHPNLVQLYELVSEGSRWFFTMELVDGVDLLTYAWQLDPEALLTQPPPPDAEPATEQGGSGPPPVLTPFNAPRLRAGLLQLAKGVEALHRERRLHRDIKPANVLVAPDGRVVLLDFGIASERTADLGDLAIDGGMFGTPEYMAPEVAAGHAPSEASDWYAVGALLYEAMTGEPPFTGAPEAVLDAKQHADPPAPSALLANIPDDLDNLCVQLLHREPQARPSGRRVLEALGQAVRSTLPPPWSSRGAGLFVGRERELRSLEAWADDTVEGRVVSVLVGGGSGIGKTSLLDRFAERMREQRPERTVLRGRCFERELVPFKVFDQVIDALTRHLATMPDARVSDLVPDDAAALLRLFPVLGRVRMFSERGPSRAQVRDPQQLRRRAFAALKSLLCRLAERHPLVLLIDDVHWGDADSAALLLSLLTPPAPPRLLLVATYRDEAREGSAFLAELAVAAASQPLAAVARMRDMTLDPLEPQDAVDLVRRLLDAAGVSRRGPLRLEGMQEPPQEGDRARALWQYVGGHPGELRSLVLALRAGARRRTGPHQAWASWAHRVEALGADARRLLEVVCLAQAPVSIGLAGQVASLRGKLAEPFAALRAAGLVSARVRGGQTRLEPRDDLLRQLVCEALPEDRARLLHGRLARALAADSGDAAERVARHYLLAGEASDGVAYALRAAEAAEASLAFGRAASLYALALDGIPDEAGGRQALEVRRARALAHAGRAAEAADEFLACARGVSSQEGAELRLDALHALLRTGRVERGLPLLDALAAELGVHVPRDESQAAALLVRLNRSLQTRGYSFVETPGLPRRATRAVELCWLAATTLMPTHPLPAACFAWSHMLLALDAGDPRYVARGLALQAALASASSARCLDRVAPKLLDGARFLARNLRDPYVHGWLQLASGIEHQARGEPARAIEHLEAAQQAFEDECVGADWELGAVHVWLQMVLGRLCAIERLRQDYPRWLQLADERGDRVLAAGLRAGAWLMRLSEAAGSEADDALASAADAEAVGAGTPLGWHRVHALEAGLRAQLHAGQAAAAHAQLERAWDELTASVLFRSHALRRDWQVLRAHLALALPSAEAWALARSLLEDLEREGGESHPDLIALQSALAWREGDAAASAQKLEASIEGYRARQLWAYEAVATRALARLRDEPGRAQQAEARLRSHGIRCPGPWARMLLPGLP